MSSNVPKTVTEELLPKGKPIYFFEKKTKHGIWNIGYVQSTHEHYIEVSRCKRARGKLLQVAYEDNRTFPSSSLLHQLDQLEVGEESQRQVDTETESVQPQEQPNSTETDAVEDANKRAQRRVRFAIPNEKEKLTTPYDEAALWANNFSSSAYFSSHQDVRYRNKKLGPVLDIGKPTSIALPQKDIGDTALITPTTSQQELKSAEQHILRRLRDMVGDHPFQNTVFNPQHDGLLTRLSERKRKTSSKRIHIKKSTFEIYHGMQI